MNWKQKRLPYNPKLKELARQLRKNSTKSEIFMWKKLKNKQLHGYNFNRQKPIDNYIVDFFCRELMLAIEIDGYTHQNEEVYEKDMTKEKKLNELGVNIIRFQDKDVFNDMDNVIRTLEIFIEKHKTHKTTPNPSKEGT